MRIRVPLATTVVGSTLLLLTASPAFAATPVSIHNFKFDPQTVTVPAGTTVTWTNQDAGTPHSVTSDSGAFDSSPSCSPSATSGCLQTGQTFSFTFNSAGTFSYHCRVHSFMTGTITVQAVTTTTALPSTTTAPPTTAPGTTARTAAPSSSSPNPAPASVAGSVATTTTLPTTGAAATGRLALGGGLLALIGLLLVGAPRLRQRR